MSEIAQETDVSRVLDVRRVAVIDFEAAYGPDGWRNDAETSARVFRSACEIGWQVVDVDVAANTACLHPETGAQLLRPPGNYYEGRDVHKLTPADTEDAPTLLEYWTDDLRHRFDRLGVTTMMAHANSFDVDTFDHSLAFGDGMEARGHSRREIADILTDARLAADGKRWRWSSTKAAARAAWPELKTNDLWLGKLAQRFGIKFTYHRAQEDAATAAKILVLAFEHKPDAKTLLAEIPRLIDRPDPDLYFSS